MSGLEDLYREIILDHYRNPRNRGELPSPPAHKAEGFNPLCGDEIVIFISVDSKGVIEDLRVGGQGCSISQSSASMMSTAIKGKSVADARATIKAFKSMMSVHEAKLDSDSEPGAEGAGASGSGSSGSESDSGQVKLGDLEALQGVVKFPVRIKCATLSWNTLVQALDEAESAKA